MYCTHGRDSPMQYLFVENLGRNRVAGPGEDRRINNMKIKR